MRQPLSRNKVVMGLGIVFIGDIVLIALATLKSLYLTLSYGTAIGRTEFIYLLLEMIALVVIFVLMKKASDYGNRLYQAKKEKYMD